MSAAQSPVDPTWRAPRNLFWRPDSRLRSGTSAALALVVLSSMLTTLSQRAAVAAPARLGVSQPTAVSTKPVAARPRPADLSQGANRRPTEGIVWPTASVAEADVPATVLGRAAGSAKVPSASTRAGKLPVYVGQPVGGGDASRVAAQDPVSRARVEILDRGRVSAAWRDGLVVRVGRADGAAGRGSLSVGIDYSGFAAAFGADWSTRLRLVTLPECALTNPDRPECGSRPLASHNDVAHDRVTAEVPVPPSAHEVSTRSTAATTTLVALSAGASGSTGDYGATPLQASSSWTAGGSSGDFSWSYPVRVPPAVGPAPTVGLSYSSSAVDGRSDASNNQPSWMGEGFEYQPGFVERRYVPCYEDTAGGATNGDQLGDLCWGTENAVLSLNGRSTELVRDDATGVWRAKNDDASRIEKLTGASNGDDNGEHWKVTTADGVQYFFGLDDLPGQSAGTASTNTVRVYGNHTGEPCYNASFGSAHCNQAWRWNLDYVRDPHGGTISYWYSPESNKYAANLTDTDDVSYIRASNLTRIDYGTWDRSATDRSVTPTAQVFFFTDDRCTSNCATHDNEGLNWPDTPWDQECTGTSCPGLYSPTFWSSRRLSKITTRVTGVSGDVESWDFTHTFPPNGDKSRDGMWLESIRHTGYLGEKVTLPEVNFDFVQKANRVDRTNDGEPPMYWLRMSTIWTETGGKILITYSGPQCDSGGPMPSSPETNTLRCYPVLTEDRFTKQTKTAYWHKYVVEEVDEWDTSDRASTDVITRYEYLDGVAWHHNDDDGLTRDKFRTWADYRGYGRVRVRVGTDGNETLTQTRYYRGMDGDRLAPSGGTRNVTLPARDLNGDGDTADAADAPQVDDQDALAGEVREQTVYNGVDTDVVSTSVSEAWQSAPTATRDMGDTNSYARFSGVRTSWNAVRLDVGRGWRVSKKSRTFDGYGMETTATDFGDVARNDDDRCLKTSYARNTDSNLLVLASRSQTFAIACTATPASVDDVIGDIRTSYDQKAFGDTPIKGDMTKVENLKDWSPSAGTTWMTTASASYDPYGRVTESYDIRGNKTRKEYTPAIGGPLTSMKTINHLDWSNTENLSPAWGVTERKTDANGKITDLRYDGLGRLRKVWLPTRPMGSDPANPTSPSTEYTYTVRNSGGVNAIATTTLNSEGNYTTAYELFDSLLRPRQTQAPAPSGGGAVVTETVYDAAGRVAYTNANHHDPALTPSRNLRSLAAWEANSQNRSVYDRAGRTIASVLMSGGEEKWRTTTGYGGDRVYVTPPKGGTATTTISEARGNTIEVRQHDGRSVTGPFDASTYTYNRKSQLTGVRDAAGNAWSYQYNVQGQQEVTTDPDNGRTTTHYTEAGDIDYTIDARNQKLVYHYDSLGRKDAVYDTAVASENKLATWAYDPTGAKGRLASSSRWTDKGVNEYKVRVRGYSALYQSTGEDYVIPASETGLAGTYTFSRTYKPDGVTVATASYPNAGSLGAEQLTFTYDETTGLAERVETNWPNAGQYVTDTGWSAFAQPALVRFQQTAQNFLDQAWTYDDSTGRLKSATTMRQLAPQPLADLHYDYDEAGNVTRVADTPQGGTADVQCFGYDYARRLTSAWTPASGDCAAAPTVAGLGGPAPYWHSWAFGPVGQSNGNRVKETKYGTTTTESTYTYPATGAAQPHAVSQVVTTGTGAGTRNYRYDKAGNLECRPSSTAVNNTCPDGTGSQKLTWNSEGQLTTLTDGGKQHSYLYAADGGRLIARDPTGKTLYLPGTEIRWRSSDSVKTATRYYTHLGQVVAMRQPGTGVTWLMADHQGTQFMTVASGNQSVAWRRQTPYGGPRGTAPSAWPNQLGFVGGTIDGGSDLTGLINVGARPYDPTIGKFAAVDPLMDLAAPEHWNGYAYANNSPVTLSDPSGLSPEDAQWEEKHPGTHTSDNLGWDKYGCPDGDCSARDESGQPKRDRVFTGANGTTVTRDSLGNYYLDGYRLPPTTVDVVRLAAIVDKNRGEGQGSPDRNNTTDPVARMWAILQDIAAACGEMDECNDRNGDLYLGVQYDIDQVLQMRHNSNGYTWNGLLLEMVQNAAALCIGSGLRGGCMGRQSLTGSTGGCRSFDADTRVLMADGTSKRIADVRPGDLVWALDPETGEAGARMVTDTWAHEDMLHEFRVGDGLLTTTADHSFWNATDREWQESQYLDPGDRLLSLDGRTVTAGGLGDAFVVGRAYNLTIAQLHTYYVLAGNVPVLVHNESGEPCLSTAISRQKQGRHVQGDPLHNGTGKSYFNSQADAQGVLDAYHRGDTTVLGRTSSGNIVVRYDGVTGYNNNPGAGFHDQPTNVFMIKGTKSPSVVPISPGWSPKEFELVEPSLERENRLVLDVVQAALGLISPEILAISVKGDPSRIALYVAVRVRNAQVDEDVEDLVFELETLQSGPTAIEVSIFVGAPIGDWPGISGRSVYLAKASENQG
ncbi:RHS repeat-associated core domain-containing protein [Micromonospora lupini]|uniref:YD repeat-containing protein n=1 Tax=Micromonospora lupini str. Lupac 08 TaxID=1150864 RepID=I0KYU8_9ACTN|nr:RHS repeat-associated core domain-containing protein [Micromonospora lupini]CCH16745.1 YD repeat-containing protein [Micromonospora lupini str. Lupac 08]